MPTKIIMPQLGESVVEGTISRWLKQEGEPVEEMEALLEVSTDKVDSEIPSPARGTVLQILVSEGETVRAGTVIAWVGQPGEALPELTGAGPHEAAPQGPAAQPEGPGAAAGSGPGPAAQPIAAGPGDGQPGAPAVAPGAEGSPPAGGRSRGLGFISPIVARLAQEHQIDLAQVPGTGEGGRITKKDVLAFLAQRTNPPPWETPGEGDLFRPTEMVFGQPGAGGKTEPVRVRGGPAASPEPAPTLPGEGRILPLSNMRRKIAEHMAASKRTAPHVTTVMEANLRRVVAHSQANREAFARDGVKLTYTAYFALAAAQALRAFPLVNASWREEGLLLHPQVNLGLAVSLGEEGLIVPVIKNADGLSLLGLARAISDLAGRARERRLQPDEVQGGTFTLTNHGIAGSLFATPVIHQPQCAILGIGAIQKRVVVLEDASGAETIAICPMVYLSLTFDHRILDGASADGFLAKVVAVLENWP